MINLSRNFCFIALLASLINFQLFCFGFRSDKLLNIVRTNGLVLCARINRHEEIFGLINIFGRIAEQNSVGFTSKYVAESYSPFSLWLPSRFSRRLKVDHPHWENIFAGEDCVNREQFKARISALPFKYPINEKGRPVVPPQKLTALHPEVSVECLQNNEEIRAKVNLFFQNQEIPGELLERVFEAFLGASVKNNATMAEAICKNDFERILLQWGRVGQGESDPVVDWEIFLDNLFMSELTIPGRGKPV